MALAKIFPSTSPYKVETSINFITPKYSFSNFVNTAAQSTTQHAFVTKASQPSYLLRFVKSGNKNC